jgi:hypothetical protein
VKFQGLSGAHIGDWTDENILKTLLIYEDVAAGVRARWFCKGLARTLDCRLEEQMWNFSVLGIREVRSLSLSGARKADILVVSISREMELPCTIRTWLEMWLSLLKKKKPALVGLFASSSQQRIASIHAHLSGVARTLQHRIFSTRDSRPIAAVCDQCRLRGLEIGFLLNFLDLTRTLLTIRSELVKQYVLFKIWTGASERS